MARIALWLALAALAAVPVRAAEETAESATTQALAHAARAKVHYDLGEYERAAEEYILVYRIKPRPGTLFNIAQSYRKAGQYGKAKQFYESYLRETPETKNRAVVEKAIKEIDGLLAKEKRAKDGPPQGVAQDRGLAPPPATAATVTPPTTTAAVTPPALPSATHPADKLALPPADRGLALPPTTVAGTQPPLPTLLTPAAQKASTPSAASAQPAASTGSPSTASPVAAQSSQATVAAAAIPAKGTAPVTAAPNATPASARQVPLGATSSTVPAASRASRTWAWVSAGTAVALVGGGALFFSKASSTQSQINGGGTRAQLDGWASDVKSQHTLSAVLLGAGAAAGVAAGVLFLLPSGSGANAGVQGKF